MLETDSSSECAKVGRCVMCVIATVDNNSNDAAKMCKVVQCLKKFASVNIGCRQIGKLTILFEFEATPMIIYSRQSVNQLFYYFEAFGGIILAQVNTKPNIKIKKEVWP